MQKVLHKCYELATELNSIILHKIELSSQILFLVAFCKASAWTFISVRLKKFVRIVINVPVTMKKSSLAGFTLV